MLHEDFTPEEYELLLSGISAFAENDLSPVTQEQSRKRLNLAEGDVVGPYEIVRVEGGRFSVKCLECGTPNNVSRGKIKIRGCPQCRDNRAADRWHIPLRVGEIYGFLKVVQDSSFTTTSTGRRAHRVQCVCVNCSGGAAKEYEASHVRSGKTVSCGCFRRETSSKRGFVALVGEKYGKWTVLRLHDQAEEKGKKSRKRYWCRCDCGTEAPVLSFQLKNAQQDAGCKECGNRKSGESRRGKKRNGGGVGSRVPVDVQKAKRKEWKRTNESELRKDAKYRLISNMRKRCSRLIRGGSLNRLVFGTTRRQFLGYIEAQFKNGMSWDNYGSVWHVDHLFPLSRVDKSNPCHLKAATNWRNLRPLLGPENIEKLDAVTSKIETLFEYIVDAVTFEEEHGQQYTKPLQVWLTEKGADTSRA